ncbi:MAG: DUF885 domain-containing protein [Dehalococcoidia bacterium]|nr:DUF885 domain-containing protein [Dehalococcoidia bacterium]
MLSSADQEFDDIAGRVLNATWKFYPDRASKEGLHDYDGGMTDISPTSIAGRVREVETFIVKLHRLDETLLSDNHQFDRRILISALRDEKFRLTELETYQRWPMEALEHVDVSNYILRDYAPRGERVEALTAALEKVPGYLEALQTGLDPGVGAPVIEASIEAYEGMRSFYDTDLSLHVSGLVEGTAFSRFDEARGTASSALESFVAHLRTMLEASPPDFAIGATNFRWMLEHGEMVDLSIDRLESIGEQDLHRNLIHLRKLATDISPEGDVVSLLQETKKNHPAASMLTAETRGTLDDIRQFVLENDLVTIPSNVACIVKETPMYMRWAFAVMDLPGTFETTADEAYYYVTPVDASWTEAEKDEWLSSFNYPLLKNVSIHEAYPGHYVHHLHSKNASSKLSLVFGAYSFRDGWAHYTQEMMIEQGFGGNDQRVQAMQLMEALLRNCRFLCAIRMHTQGMTLEEAKRFFMEQAYLEPLTAEREALRGTYDPMYLNYTLGKLQIMKLREDYKARVGESFSLKDFHDKLLSFGAPPIPLVREAMLGPLAGPPL